MNVEREVAPRSQGELKKWRSYFSHLPLGV
jgi:hypothetical protein